MFFHLSRMPLYTFLLGYVLFILENDLTSSRNILVNGAPPSDTMQQYCPYPSMGT